jgi:hypothetical protein
MTFLVFATARRRPDQRDLLVTLPFLVLGLWAMRNAAIAPLVVLPVLARLVSRPEPDPGNRLAVPVMAALALIGTVFLQRAVTASAYDLRDYPVSAMQSVERAGLLGSRLLTTDQWSGFVVHEYWPRQRVFIDDRYDMYPTGLIHEYLDLARVRPDWAATLDRHDVRVVVWPAGKPLSLLLETAPGWRRSYADRLATVFVRR